MGISVPARQQRPPVFAPSGMVATSQPLAAAAGLDVLRRGGSAVDAAVAAAIALTIVQPASNGVGGDLFALVWDGSQLHGLNASGRSPGALTLPVAQMAAMRTPPRPGAGRSFGGDQAGVAHLPEQGWPPVTVPGAPAGWRDLHGRFGRLPFAALFADAIRYADDGYPVSPSVARSWARTASWARSELVGPEFEEWHRVYGTAPAVGQRRRNPDAARTLRLIADSKADEFYTGEIAAAVAGHARATGGLLDEQDLAAHRSAWVEPISARYRGADIWELPPNGQGLAALLALKLLDGVDPAGLSQADWLHWQIEAMKLAFADTHAVVADPDRAPAPISALLADAYAADRRAMIGPRARLPVAGAPARGGTVYLCATDADGMMVSLIQSNYLGFGSYVVIPGYGFGLQNRGAGFSLDPAHPNVVAGAKRPFHTIIPGFLTRDGEPVGPFGVMGGHMQPQGHVQLISATLDHGLDPQAALGRPRWYWHAGYEVRLEPGFPDDVVGDLENRGHEVTVHDDPATFGFGQAIWRTDAGYVGGSEPRADGVAVGF
jgi:gamma-glutamyltranspeptidase/glutathione hydrolase